jgi:hypothetical protein
MRLIDKIARRVRELFGIHSPSQHLMKRSQEEFSFWFENGVIHIHEPLQVEEVAE